MRCGVGMALIAVWAALSGCTRTRVVHRPGACVIADAGNLADVGLPADASKSTDVGAPDGGLPLSPLLATGGFTDMTASLGGAFAIDPVKKGAGREPWAGIGMLLDLDRDGLLDFVATDGMSEVRWGRAIPTWKWITAPMVDVVGEGVRCLAATDVDGDGYPEVLIGGNRIRYMVRHKDETYGNEADARGLGLPDGSSVQSVTPADLDADGLLDLVVGEMACDGKSRLLAFINLGDGSYAERSLVMGLEDFASNWQVLATDFDGDRFVDLMAIKENCALSGGNAYFHHRGWQDGKVYEAKVLAPVFLAPSDAGGTPMGGSVGDVDGDGRLDYLFSETGYRDLQQTGMDMRHPDLQTLLDHAIAGNHLLLGQADGTVLSRGVEAGIVVPLNSDGRTMTSWSARLFDLDHDGHLDMLISHGLDYASFLLNDEGGFRPVLYRARGDGTFSEESKTFGLPSRHLARAMAMADIDQDGDLDVFFGGQTNGPLLLRNDIQHQNQWLTVSLQGAVSNLWGLQARVRLQTDVRTYVAEMSTHAPTHTMDQPLVHFGIPAGQKVQELVVQWPSGYDQHVKLDAANQHLQVVEPALVKLSTRSLVAQDGTVVTVTAQAFTPQGQATTAATTIELAPGAPGTWQGPATCQGGTCSRKWLPPLGKTGEAAFAVAFAGKPLTVRPKVRFAPP